MLIIIIIMKLFYTVFSLLTLFFYVLFLLCNNKFVRKQTQKTKTQGELYVQLYTLILYHFYCHLILTNLPESCLLLLSLLSLKYYFAITIVRLLEFSRKYCIKIFSMYVCSIFCFSYYYRYLTKMILGGSNVSLNPKIT